MKGRIFESPEGKRVLIVQTGGDDDSPLLAAWKIDRSGVQVGEMKGKSEGELKADFAAWSDLGDAMDVYEVE